jgi:hypothetical protein
MMPLFEHPDNQANHPLVSDAMPQKLDQPFVVHLIKEPFDISLHYMVDPFALNRESQRIKALVLAASGSVPVAAVFKYRFVNRLQRPLHRSLHNFILKIADPQWTALLAARFGNIAPALGSRTISHPSESLRQILKIALQIPAVLLLGYAIHPGRLVGFQTAVAGPQIVHIRDVVIQTGKYQIRLFARLFTYPLQVCCHRLITLCMMSVLSPSVVDSPWEPSLSGD